MATITPQAKTRHLAALKAMRTRRIKAIDPKKAGMIRTKLMTQIPKLLDLALQKLAPHDRTTFNNLLKKVVDKNGK